MSPRFGRRISEIREIKPDVTWSYVVFFSSNPSLNHIKIEKCLLRTIRHKNNYYHSAVQRAKDRRQKFHFCRLPFDVRPRNVKLNLSIISVIRSYVKWGIALYRCYGNSDLGEMYPV